LALHQASAPFRAPFRSKSEVFQWFTEPWWSPLRAPSLSLPPASSRRPSATSLAPERSPWMTSADEPVGGLVQIRTRPRADPLELRP